MSTFGTSTLPTPLRITKNSSKVITVKGNLNSVAFGGGVEISGHLVAVDVFTSDTDSTSTYGTGVGSGTNVDATGSTAVSGVRVFRSYPTVALASAPTTAVAGSNIALLRFTVTANSAGPVGISKFSLNLATTSAKVTNLNVFGFTDSAYSQPISGVSTGGQLMASNFAEFAVNAPEVGIYPKTSAGATTTIQIAAGEPRYFEVRATVTVVGSATAYSVATTLNGVSGYMNILPSGLIATTAVAVVDGASQGSTYGANTNRSFIWSPNSTTTPNSAVGDVDWFNGYGLPGLPSSGVTHSRTQ